MHQAWQVDLTWRGGRRREWWHGEEREIQLHSSSIESQRRNHLLRPLVTANEFSEHMPSLMEKNGRAKSDRLSANTFFIPWNFEVTLSVFDLKLYKDNDYPNYNSSGHKWYIHTHHVYTTLKLLWTTNTLFTLSFLTKTHFVTAECISLFIKHLHSQFRRKHILNHALFTSAPFLPSLLFAHCQLFLTHWPRLSTSAIAQAAMFVRVKVENCRTDTSAPRAASEWDFHRPLLTDTDKLCGIFYDWLNEI